MCAAVCVGSVLPTEILAASNESRGFSLGARGLDSNVGVSKTSLELSAMPKLRLYPEEYPPRVIGATLSRVRSISFPRGPRSLPPLIRAIAVS